MPQVPRTIRLVAFAAVAAALILHAVDGAGEHKSVHRSGTAGKKSAVAPVANPAEQPQRAPASHRLSTRRTEKAAPPPPSTTPAVKAATDEGKKFIDDLWALVKPGLLGRLAGRTTNYQMFTDEFADEKGDVLPHVHNEQTAAALDKLMAARFSGACVAAFSARLFEAYADGHLTAKSFHSYQRQLYSEISTNAAKYSGITVAGHEEKVKKARDAVLAWHVGVSIPLKPTLLYEGLSIRNLRGKMFHPENATVIRGLLTVLNEFIDAIEPSGNREFPFALDVSNLVDRLRRERYFATKKIKNLVNMLMNVRVAKLFARELYKSVFYSLQRQIIDKTKATHLGAQILALYDAKLRSLNDTALDSVAKDEALNRLVRINIDYMAFELPSAGADALILKGIELEVDQSRASKV